jgi:hypothetical protein
MFRRFAYPMLFATLASVALGQAPAKKDDAYDYGTAAASGAQPSYPGIPPSAQNKLEIEMGPAKARFYGTVLLNTQFSDSGVFGQDLALWALPDSGPVAYPDGTTGRAGNNHDLLFSMRQSVVGFTLNPSKPSEKGWNPSALLEVDFFGTRPVDGVTPNNRVLNQPRLRLGYLQLEKGSIKIVAGQDKMILSPLDPVSLSHVAAPLGATVGDLWAWLPQVRVDWTHKMGKTGLLAQVGIFRPQFGDPRLETAPTASTSIDIGSSGLGERSTQPFYQGRVALSRPFRGRTATIGNAVHFGEERVGVNSKLQSWAYALDVDIPLDRHLIFRGEGFVGSNLIPFQGGIDQGAAVTAAPIRIRRIGSGGGWAEFTILPTAGGKNAIYVGAGTDDPRNRNLLPGSGRSKNSFVWASYFRKLTNSVTLAAEWSNWQFQTVNFVNNVASSRGATGSANIINVSLAYQF